MGGSITAEVAAFTKPRELTLSSMGLDGKPLRTRSERVICVLIIALFAVGCLPKELGDLANLTVLDVSGNRLTGQLSIRPTTWSSHLTRRVFAQFRAQGRRP